MFYAHVLRSLKDGTSYYGSSEDTATRLHEHNGGSVRYTKGHRPYELHYTEVFATRAEAVRREEFFKSTAGYRWLRDKGIT
jgi:putative endonuclease